MANVGKIKQIIGPVVDVSFEAEGSVLPLIMNALEVKRDDGQTIILEVQQHLGEDGVRTVAMDSTDGLRRGMSAVDTGAPHAGDLEAADLVGSLSRSVPDALADAISVKADWGHSSNIVGVELCQMARAKHLVLFHHEPANDDATLEGLLKEARRFEELTRGEQALKVSAAYDGLELEP